MNNVRVGIIGIGNMGSAHAACILRGEIPGMELACVCDLDEKKIQLFHAQYPEIPTFSEYSGLLSSNLCDAVIVAVPHRLHSVIAMDALKTGHHVLVEKPEDVAVSAAKALNEVAERSGKVFGIMFNQRTNLLFQKAREIVKSGQLGQLKRSVWIITNWYRTQHYYDSGSWRATWSGEGGGVLLNQAPHQLDLWQWICGMPVEVTGFCDEAKFHNIEVEDDAAIFVRYANGATGAFFTSTGEYPGTNRLEISGERGKLVLEDGLLKWWKTNVSERDVCFCAPENPVEITSTYSEFRPETEESAHPGILRNFTDAILHGTELLAPGQEGIHELTISNAAYLSQWMGNVPVSLPLDTEKFDKLLSEKAKGSRSKDVQSQPKLTEEYMHRWQVNW